MLTSLTIGLTPACADPAAITGSHDISAVDIRPAVFIPQVAAAKRADDLVNSIGVNVHLSYFRTPYGTGWNDIVKPKILELGVRHLRDGGVVVPDNKWMEIVYGRMKEVAKHGVKFNLIMRPPVGSDDYTRMDHFDRLMQYAGPAVESVEGLNEHDLSKRSGWTAEVRSFQKALYQRVKSDPRYHSMPVYGPSIGHPVNAPAVGDLSAYMDQGSLHPYPGGSPPLTNMIQHEGLLRSVAGDKPFVVTESGYHTALGWTGGHPGVAEEAMARYIMRLVLEYFDLGIPRTYLYELIDQGDDQRDREQNFGLLRMNGTEKPAFTALKNLIGLLADPGPEFPTGRLAYAARGATSGVRQVLLQKRDGRYYLILWQNKMSFDLGTKSLIFPKTLDVALQLDKEAAAVKVYAPLESASPIEKLERVRSIAITVPDSPIVVEIQP